MKHDSGYRRHQQVHELDKYKYKEAQRIAREIDEQITEAMTFTEIDRAIEAAWRVRNNAIARNTKVGCAIVTEMGIFTGCNISHVFNKSIHAEVSALANMISFAGESVVRDVVIAAEREKFTPCGDCCDWLMQFSDELTRVHFSNEVDDTYLTVVTFALHDLMPHYPR